jgi:hypothetical protein
MKTSTLLQAIAFVPLLVSCTETPAPIAQPPAATATAASTASTPAPASASASASVSASASAAPEMAPLALPAQLQGKAVVVPKGDPDEARADLASAVKAPGEGGITQGLVVRLTGDLPVWRMWSGPARKDASGRTNRLGQWWAYDAPHDTQQQYRSDYEICLAWNELAYVAKCTLKKGAVVAIGPGNSVSPKTCGDPAGKEAYPANAGGWQVWISKVWSRSTELVCPAETTDYEADPADISHPRKLAKPAAAR